MEIRKLIYLLVLLFVLYLYLTGVERRSARIYRSVLLSILPMLPSVDNVKLETNQSLTGLHRSCAFFQETRKACSRPWKWSYAATMAVR